MIPTVQENGYIRKEMKNMKYIFNEDISLSSFNQNSFQHLTRNRVSFFLSLNPLSTLTDVHSLFSISQFDLVNVTLGPDIHSLSLL